MRSKEMIWLVAILILPLCAIDIYPVTAHANEPDHEVTLRYADGVLYRG